MIHQLGVGKNNFHCRLLGKCLQYVGGFMGQPPIILIGQENDVAGTILQNLGKFYYATSRLLFLN
jgi:hypothetical protein